MVESALTSKGQTTIPKAVRDALGVRSGDRIRYVISDGEVLILAVRPVSGLFGALKHEGPPVTLSDMERAIVEGATGSSSLGEKATQT
ncbi:MAG: type II toxin-antitoxin system PrlF family antitoxin [Gammaproteobacteria bacterium]|nr:type II toxin-antitoxin system PrlF family antitoxin [Gammaproteobacteria bacterium]